MALPSRVAHNLIDVFLNYLMFVRTGGTPQFPIASGLRAAFHFTLARRCTG
jgi:hypothetical protein